MQRALAPALVIDEKGASAAQQDVARLKVAIHEVVVASGEEKLRETDEIVFEGLFVEGNAGELEEVVFEVVQVPGDGLLVEDAARIADRVVEGAAGFDLKAREQVDGGAVDLDHGRGDAIAGAIPGEEFEEGGIAQILLEVGAAAEIFGIDFGDGQGVAAEMTGKFEEGRVFLADVVEDADGAGLVVGEANDFAAGTAEFALYRLDSRGRRVEMLLEKILENAHRDESSRSSGR